MADRIPSNRDRYVELCLIGTEQRADKPRQPQIRQSHLPRRTQATAEERREFERIAEVMGVEPNQLLERLQDKTIPEHRYSAMWVLVQYGVRLWPLEWRYIGWMVYVTLVEGVFQLFVGLFMAALMLPRVPELARFQPGAQMISQIMPPIIRDWLPLLVTLVFTANAIRSMLEEWRSEP